MQLLRTISSK